MFGESGLLIISMKRAVRHPIDCDTDQPTDQERHGGHVVTKTVLISHDGDRIVVSPLGDGLSRAKHHHPGDLATILKLRQQEADDIRPAQSRGRPDPIRNRHVRMRATNGCDTPDRTSGSLRGPFRAEVSRSACTSSPVQYHGSSSVSSLNLSRISFETGRMSACAR